MLPGFRFLFAAVLLAMSVLVFGLGAAALLRAAHEEVAGIRWSPPEPVLAQNEPPMLALLRAEPAVAEAPDALAPAAVPAATPAEPDTTAAIAALPPEPDATAAAEPEKFAALKPDAAEEPTKTGTPPADNALSAEPVASPEAPAPAPDANSVQETRQVATVDATPALPEPAVAPAAAAPTPAPAPTSAPAEQTAAAPPAADIATATTKTAALPAPAVAAEKAEAAKLAKAKADQEAAKKRAEAQRIRERRRAALRARQAAAQVQAQQPTFDPFPLLLAAPAAKR